MKTYICDNCGQIYDTPAWYMFAKTQDVYFLCDFVCWKEFTTRNTVTKTIMEVQPQDPPKNIILDS